MGIKGTSFLFFLLAWPFLIIAVNHDIVVNISREEPPPKPTSDVADVKLENSAELVAQDNLPKITTEGREFDPLTASEDDHSEAIQLESHAYADTNTSASSITTTSTPSITTTPAPSITTISASSTTNTSASSTMTTSTPSITNTSASSTTTAPAPSTTTTSAPSTTTIPPPSHEPTVMQALTTPSILIFLYSRLTLAITFGFILIAIVLHPRPDGMETIVALVIGCMALSAGEIASDWRSLETLVHARVAMASGFPDTSEFRSLISFLSTAVYTFGWYLGCGLAPSLVRDYEGRAYIIMLLNSFIIFCYYYNYIVNYLM